MTSESDQDSDGGANDVGDFKTRAAYIQSFYHKLFTNNQYSGWKCAYQRANGSLCNHQLGKTGSDNLMKHLEKHDDKSIKARLKMFTDSLSVRKNEKRRADTIELPSTKRRREEKELKEDSFVQSTYQATTQTRIDHQFASQSDSSTKKKALSEATALFFAVHNIPLHLAGSPYLATMLESYHDCAKSNAKQNSRSHANHKVVTTIDSRETVLSNQKDLAVTIAKDVMTDLRKSSYPVTLAYDGWSNVNNVHIQNICAQGSQATYLLKSDPTTRASAEVLSELVINCVNELIEEKVVVASVVADNASVCGKMGRLISAEFPWIVPLPCASHTLQLCVVQMFDNCALAESLKSITKAVHFAIYKSSVRLAEFRRIQGQNVHNLSKPQRTRWNSYYRAFLSLLRARDWLRIALATPPGTRTRHPILDKLDETFWTNLQILVDFLEPFSTASQIVQSDRAGLLDVHYQFQLLSAHVLRALLPLQHAASVVQQAISSHWHQHVHQEAVLMTAIFAFEKTEVALFSDEIRTTGPEWFSEWASHLWMHKQSIEGLDSNIPADQKEAARLAVKTRIDRQFDDFRHSSFPFDLINDSIMANRPARVAGKRHCKLFDVVSPWLRKQGLDDSAELAFAALTKHQSNDHFLSKSSHTRF